MANRRFLIAALVLSSAAGPVGALAQERLGPAMTIASGLGGILVGPDRMTLYVHDRDDDGVSRCYDACADNWIPFIVEANEDLADEDWSIVERTDGIRMWAYMGQPLYYSVEDAYPRDVSGQGVDGVWRVVVPIIEM